MLLFEDASKFCPNKNQVVVILVLVTLLCWRFFVVFSTKIHCYDCCLNYTDIVIAFDVLLCPLPNSISLTNIVSL